MNWDQRERNAWGQTAGRRARPGFASPEKGRMWRVPKDHRAGPGRGRGVGWTTLGSSAWQTPSTELPSKPSSQSWNSEHRV